MHSTLFHGVFENKKIFITGNTGIIGSWLSLWLHNLNSNVVGYSLDIPTTPSLFESIDLSNSIKHIFGDINDLNHLKQSMQDEKPDFVFHLAAQPIVKTSYEKPLETINTNVLGTANVLESVRSVPSIHTVIILTSDKCYENKEIDYAYKEDDPMGGLDPYSASKGAAELITQCYRHSFFNNSENSVEISTVRAGNVICGGDWAERIVPDSIRSLSLKKSIEVRSPDSIRPWQHVLEPISGMLCLASKMWQEHSFNESWNFGPKTELQKISVKEIVNKIIGLWGSGDWIDISDREKFHEAHLLMLDSSKSMNQLGWVPVYSLDECVDETVNWYKEFYSNPANLQNFTLKQIQNYINKAKQIKVDWIDSD